MSKKSQSTSIKDSVKILFTELSYELKEKMKAALLLLLLLWNHTNRGIFWTKNFTRNQILNPEKGKVSSIL